MMPWILKICEDMTCWTGKRSCSSLLLKPAFSKSLKKSLFGALSFRTRRSVQGPVRSRTGQTPLRAARGTELHVPLENSETVELLVLRDC